MVGAQHQQQDGQPAELGRYALLLPAAYDLATTQSRFDAFLDKAEPRLAAMPATDKGAT
jgi:hypothetical protein